MNWSKSNYTYILQGNIKNIANIKKKIIHMHTNNLAVDYNIESQGKPLQWCATSWILYINELSISSTLD